MTTVIKSQRSKIHAFTKIRDIFLEPMNGDLQRIYLLQKIADWCEHNRENNEAPQKDGYVWMYHTKEKLLEMLCPIFSMRTLERTIADLIKDEWLIKDCFNRDKLLRTAWYRPNWSKIRQLEIDTLQKEAKKDDVIGDVVGKSDSAKLAECITPDLAECITPDLAECITPDLAECVYSNKKN
jgi:hypothetical protein